MNALIQKAIVEVDISTLKRSARGSITGVIQVRIDNVSFPEASWNDFPVIILSWWLESVSQMLQGPNRSCECRFMDGPLLFRLERQHDDIWDLFGFHNDNIELTAKVSGRAFIYGLLEVSNLILKECQRREWHGQDIQMLALAIRLI